MQKTERYLFIMQRINAGRLPTPATLAEECECSERTILDDVRFLKERAGMKIRFDTFQGGYVNLEPKKTLPPIELTEGELFALTLGKDMLTEYSGTVFEPILENAIERLHSAFLIAKRFKLRI